MGREGSMDMWTTGTIRTMGITGRFRSGTKGPSTTFTRTKRGTAEATWVRQAMTPDANMRPGLREAAAAMAVADTADS